MNLLAERISNATRRPALVVHYPLAPDHPYPAPLESVIADYRALLPHVPAEKIVLFSESSGAALALSAMLRLAAEEKPAGVVTVSAVTDLSLSSPSIDANTPTDAGVTRELLGSFIGAYLAGAPADQAPQSPIVGDLREMPPLLMAVGGAEALLDDTLRFGEAAAAAGVETDIDVYEGMPHAFSLSTLDEGNPTGRTLLDRVADWVSKRAG
jgi:epsilon-lactone hydrolase